MPVGHIRFSLSYMGPELVLLRSVHLRFCKITHVSLIMNQKVQWIMVVPLLMSSDNVRLNPHFLKLSYSLLTSSNKWLFSYVNKHIGVKYWEFVKSALLIYSFLHQCVFLCWYLLLWAIVSYGYASELRVPIQMCFCHDMCHLAWGRWFVGEKCIFVITTLVKYHVQLLFSRARKGLCSSMVAMAVDGG